MEYNIKFTAEQLNICVLSLKKQPYDVVIQTLRSIEEQIQEIQKASANTEASPGQAY